MGTTTATNLEQPQVIPSQGDLLGDLLNLDLGPPVNVPQVSSMQMGAVDLLGGRLDSLVSIFLLSFSRGTTARSVSLSCVPREVGSPCEWRGVGKSASSPPSLTASPE